MPRIGKSKASFGGQLTRFSGCVISYCPIASAVGSRILQEGGNAVDAAVATGIALSITYPQAGNLGGGGFMLAQMNKGETKFLDYRETAPASIRAADYLSSDGSLSNKSTLGGSAVGIPGTIAGMGKALEELGTMAWDTVLSRCIDLADTGVWLTNRQASFLKIYQEDFAHFPSSMKIFTGANQENYLPGELFRQKDLAKTLRTLADDGPRTFYEGKISKRILETVNASGGKMSAEDLSGYEAKWRAPLRRKAFGREIITASMPSAGGAVLCLALGLLESSGVCSTKPRSAERYALLSKVFRLAYAARADLIGDPDFQSATEIERVKTLTSKIYSPGDIDSLSRDLGIDTKATTNATVADKNTTHYCVFDSEGNVVSNTYSLNTLFGSKLIVEGTGVLLNNTIDDFCLAPGQPNWYALIDSEKNNLAPLKRPVGSMTPTVVLNNGVVELAIGASGGPRIPTLITQVILNMYCDGLPLARAIQEPRVHHQYLPDHLHVEMSIPEQTLKTLEKMGVDVNVVSRLGIGAGAHRVEKDDILHATLDPRF